MASTPKIAARMATRVADLCATFTECLDRFEVASRFTGPSRYFHQKTIAIRSTHGSISTLFDDERFLEYLYATLTAWGLHRMGPGNTRLQELEAIQTSFKAHAAAIDQLAGLSLGACAEGQVQVVARALWNVVASLQVSVADARIVANSKALHHVLPDLVPPMDREYTFSFFYGRPTLSIDEGEAFREMFCHLDRIARRNLSHIGSRVGHGWHTGHSKVVDNAIVGFMIKNRLSA